jgi:GDPmannose 4,6-dehydratase
MIPQDIPEDYAGNCVTTPVRDFIRMAFNEVGMNEIFRKDDNEKAVVVACSNLIIR